MDVLLKKVFYFTYSMLIFEIYFTNVCIINIIMTITMKIFIYFKMII